MALGGSSEEGHSRLGKLYGHHQEPGSLLQVEVFRVRHTTGPLLYVTLRTVKASGRDTHGHKNSSWFTETTFFVR